jgi:H+/Cl- antiporter ClcA
MSLLAGGSIGPEASLMAASAAIGAYVANEAHLSETKRLLVLASIGALLVAFLGSLVVVLVPLLMLRKEHRKQSRHLPLQPVLVILLAAVGSLGILELLNMLTGKSGGYGTMPTLPHYAPRDFIVAVALGFVAAFIALSLTWLIQQSWRIAQRVDSQRLPRHEYTVGATFAAVLGGIYLFGGRTIEFSGSIGSNLLIDDGVRYGVWALLGLIGAKLLATAWSKGTGYRGGLVFPSIYTGIALGLAVGHLPGGLGGAGAIVGGISGVMSAAVGSPMVAGIFLVAILPVHLWPVAACAIVGTVAFDKTRKHLFKHPTPSR